MKRFYDSFILRSIFTQFEPLWTQDLSEMLLRFSTVPLTVLAEAYLK
jgi:hypothetical protein